MSSMANKAIKNTEAKTENSGFKGVKSSFPESTSSPVHQILSLQKIIGNLAIQRLFDSGHIQAKLKIGQPNDIYEQEADRVAEQVMQMPENSFIRYQQSSIRKRSESVQAKPTWPSPGGSQLGEVPIQAKSLSTSITRLIQRQPEKEKEEEDEEAQAKLAENLQLQRKKEPEEEEKTLLTKQVHNQIPVVTSDIECSINNLKGGGQSLSKSTRDFFEPRFGVDFSQVRVHHNVNSAKISRAINARAFTLGRDIVFDSGQYYPGSTRGKQLLAHELTHVVQQGEQKLPPKIQRWSAEDHGEITNSVISAPPHAGLWSKEAMEHVAYLSGEMDLRGCNYLSIIFGLTEDEAPNHGEANRYLEENTDKNTGTGKLTWRNEARMNKYTREAIALANSDGLTKLAFVYLGLALHVGQDRGAHGEGVKGRGHDDPRCSSGWNPDDPVLNARGYEIAKEHTSRIIAAFYRGLTDQRKGELKSVTLGTLAGPIPSAIGAPLPGLPSLTLNPQLQLRPPLLYMGVMKEMFKKESGLPVRLGGVFTPLYTSGLAYLGDRGNTIAYNQQIGLRLMRITPRIYVDVFGGGVLGVGVNDRTLMAGLSHAVHITYTGKQSDYPIILNKIWDLTGNRDLLVIGVGGSFEETKLFK